MVLLPLILLSVLVLWAMVVVGDVARGPRAVTFAGDFALNISSAYVLEHGGNPYDGHVLLHAEQSYLTRQGIPTKLGSAQVPLTWGGYPPLFFWLLAPFTHLAFRWVALVWIGLLMLTITSGFVAVLHYLGWTSIALPTAVFVIMPQSIIEAYYGNPSGLVIGIIFLSLLLQRNWPFAGGLLLSLAFLKPQLVVPALVLFTIFLVSDRRRFLAGVGIGLFAFLLATLWTVGLNTLFEWVHGLFAVSRMVSSQPNMAPLIGIYAAWAPSTVRTIIELVAVVLAIVLTVFQVHQFGDGDREGFPPIAFLWTIWFLVLPYAHFGDEILLAPAVLSLLGCNGCAMANPTRATALYLIFFSILLFSATFHGAQLLSLPLVVVAGILYIARDDLKSTGIAGVRASSSA